MSITCPFNVHKTELEPPLSNHLYSTGVINEIFHLILGLTVVESLPIKDDVIIITIRSSGGSKGHPGLNYHMNINLNDVDIDGPIDAPRTLPEKQQWSNSPFFNCLIFR